ncbi:MAG: transcriptional regulator [Rhizonema sp. PD38]|nr:transcriptional regulator [Rhizonema sp. PD38]
MDGILLAEYQQKIITTEEENEQAIRLTLTLEHRPNRTPEEEMLLELWVTLIEKFEETHYPIPQVHQFDVNASDRRTRYYSRSIS